MSNEAKLNEIGQYEAQAARAVTSGQYNIAIRAWEQILTLDPNHVSTLAKIGKFAIGSGDFLSAQRAFQRIVEIDPTNSQYWVNLAIACKGLKDDTGEELAITSALMADPMDLLALLMRGSVLERQGKRNKAAAAYGAAATVAPAFHLLHPDLRPSLEYAMQYKDAYDQEFASFLDQHLQAQYDRYQGENLARFKDSVAIMVGRKRRFDSQSMMQHYPGLLPIAFFERDQFPWLDSFEEATESIRTEFLNVLSDESGFVPYITYPTDAPLNQWAELNNSPDWSAFHLLKQGKVVEENAAKCPDTMQLLTTAPQPIQLGRTPSAMFSLLKPNTHIPPHTGVSNIRLVTHLPLIVPEKCQFRVGNDVREWVPSKAWVFDDTIEHEAINESDKLRVVLIFDIWHPSLSLVEREMISALAIGSNQFIGEIEDVGL
jgi:aspartate beta-hydroxylase